MWDSQPIVAKQLDLAVCYNTLARQNFRFLVDPGFEQFRRRSEVILCLKPVVSRGDIDTAISDMVDYAERSESADQVGSMHSVSSRERR